jgi:hypothetical protein
MLSTPTISPASTTPTTLALVEGVARTITRGLCTASYHRVTRPPVNAGSVSGIITSVDTLELAGAEPSAAAPGAIAAAIARASAAAAGRDGIGAKATATGAGADGGAVFFGRGGDESRA